MKNLITVILVLVLFNLYGQNDNSLAIIEASVNPGGVIDETGFPEPETLGSYYIEDDWLMGTIILKSGVKINNHRIKYDLENHRIEILTDQSVKICPLAMVNSFTFTGENTSRQFINKSLNINNLRVCELLYSGTNISIFKEHKIQIKESSYIPAIDMGTRNHKVVKHHEFNVSLQGGEHKINSSLKKNQVIFGKHYGTIEAYAKKNKLKLKNEEQLIQVLSFYDTLITD